MAHDAPYSWIADWPLATLADLTTKIGSGATPRGGSESYLPSRTNFAFIRSQNVFDRRFDASGLAFISDEQAAALRGVVLQPGDVLLNITGDGVTFGRAALVDEATLPACVNQHVAIVRADPSKADPGYLLSYLTHPDVKTYITSFNSGGSRRAVTKGHIESFLLPEPPLPEQRSIGATLGALDDKIESNRRVVTSALALARAQVDRFTANRSSVPYTTALEVRMGAAFKGNKFSAPGIGRPLLRIRDLKKFESATWTSETRADETVIHPGDIVVGMDAEFRATLWLGQDSVLNQRVCSFRGRPGVGRAFILAALEPELAFQEQAKTGTTVIHLNKADIETFAVPDLSVEEHRQLSEITEPLIELAVARAIEARALAATRNALLPELLSGRVRVLEAGEMAHEVFA
jgi:type I restriction enzyme S subunit